MINPWEEKDDSVDVMPWEESSDAPAKSQPNLFEMMGVPRSQPQPTFTQRYDQAAAAQAPSPSGLPSTLTGGDLPMTPEGEAQATVAMPTTEQFRGHYKLVGETPKKTSGDITEELEDLRGSENVTREDIASIPFNAALRIGQQGAGHILQGLALATPPGMESGVRDVENQSASKRLENVLTSDMAVKGKALVETALKVHPNIDPNSLGTKVGEAIGGFLPAVLTGPFAPILFGLQSAGATLEATYEDLLSQGVDKDEAARIATRKAIASGVFQGVLLKYLPHQLRKVGDKFINKIVGDVVRKELIPRAGRLALGRSAQAVEGGAFGGASVAGENIIHNRDITEGMEEGGGGMAAINAFMRRGATPQEAKWSHGEKIRRVTENVRIEGSKKRIKARDELIKRDGPITDQDLEEFGGLKAAKDEGRLSNPKLIQRLNELELKMSSDSPLEAEYQSHLDQGLSAKNKNAVYSELGDKEVARIDDNGNVVIDRFELAHALNDLPTVKERKDLIDRIVEEESVHLATTRKQALDFFMRSTKTEQDINEEIYFGKNPDARKVNYADDAATENHRTLMGYEMIRRAVQRAAKSSATETAYKIGFDRDAKRVLSAMEGMIFSMRSRLNRMKNAEGGPVVAQELILKDVTAKMAEARKIIEAKQAEKKAAPAKAEAPVAEAPKGKELIEGVDPDNIPFSQNPSSRVPNGIMDSSRKVSESDLEKMPLIEQRGLQHNHGIEYGLTLDRESLPRLQAKYDQSKKEMTDALAAGDNPKSQQEFGAAFGRLNYYGGALMGASRGEHPISGSNYSEYIKANKMPATRRPGESKKDELRRMAEEIRLRKLEAQGVALSPEEKKISEGSLVAKDVTTLAPVEKSERVGAVESGALPRLKNTAMYEQADKEVAAKRPDFDNFSEWVQNNMGQAEPEQLRDLWEDAVNKLEDAPGARFEELRSALRLTGKYGNRRIPDLNQGFALESPQTTMPKNAPIVGREGKLAWRERQVEAPVVDSLSRQHARQKVEADQRYRNKVWGAIRLKLIHESLTDRADFNRDKISLDDIDFGNEKTDHGAYTEINAQDIRNRENLLEILNDEARGSSVDARSLTRRMVAVVDKAGRVHLIGTYREGGKQRVVDPAGVANRLKPTRELNQSFLKQYRPFASVLLTDPIRGFKQQFATVTEFNQKIGTEALERSRVGDNPFIGEGEPQHPFFAEGTEGIEGEGGSFRGPFKNLVDAKTSRGAQDVGGPVNRIEAQQIVDHLLRKYGEITSEGDVQDAIESLEIRARHKKLTAKDHVAINAYRKLADHIQKADPEASQGQVLSRMIKKLWDVIDMWGENPDPSRVLAAFYGKPEAEPVRKSERNQVDLTKRGDIRNPTDQREFAGPFQRAEIPSSILGKEQARPEMFGPEIPESYVQQRVREFTEKTEPWRGKVEPPESMKVAGEEPAFRRRRDDLDRMSDEEFAVEVNKAKERIKQRAEDIRPRGETPESLEQYLRTTKMPATPFDVARAKKVRERIHRKTGELISHAEANQIARELSSVKAESKKRSDESRARRQVEHSAAMERGMRYREKRIADRDAGKVGKTMSYREAVYSLGLTGEMPKSIVPKGKQEEFDFGFEKEARAFMYDSEKVLRKMGTAKMSPNQILKTLRNKIPKDEWDMLEGLGIEQAAHKGDSGVFFGKETSGEKISPSEVMQWIDENAPSIRVKTSKADKDTPNPFDEDAGGRIDMIRDEYDAMSDEMWQIDHNWGARLSPNQKIDLLEVVPMEGSRINARLNPEEFLRSRNWSESDIVEAMRLRELADKQKKIREDYPEILEVPTGGDKFLGNAAAIYEHYGIHPSDPRKHAVHRVDLVADNVFVTNKNSPYYKQAVRHGRDDGGHGSEENTVGWVAIQFHIVDGKNTAFLFEVQSDWLADVNAMRASHTFSKYESSIADHSNRLLMKAAINYARKMGAEKFAVTDHETALITEGGDNRVEIPAGIYELNTIGNIPLFEIKADHRLPEYFYDNPRPRISDGVMSEWRLTGKIKITPGGHTRYQIEPIGGNGENAHYIHESRLDDAVETPDGKQGQYAKIQAAIRELRKEIGRPVTEPGMRFNYGTGATLVDRDTGTPYKRFDNVADAKRYVKWLVEKGMLEKDALDPGDGGYLDIVQGDLHKKAQELSGDPGESVNLGKHDAFKLTPDALGRSDSLLRGSFFKNPDGTSKTDATGKSYKMPEPQEDPYTIFGPRSRVPGGFEKSTKEQMDRFRKWAASPTLTNPEELMVDLQSPIPRFAENINSGLTRALGFERVPILGKMFGPRARIRDEVDKSVIGYAVKRSIGNSQSALIGARMNALKDSLGEPFAQNKEGEITNVKANPEQSRFISDLFEDWQRQIVVPENMKSMKNIDYHGIEHRIFSDKDIAKYVANNPVGIELTPEQDKFFRAMHDVLRDGYEYLTERRIEMEELKGDKNTQKILMGFSEGTEIYPFPRVALHKRSVGPAKGEWERRIGGSYRVENERQYKTEAEGQKTVAYEPDMVKRLATFVQRVYKAVADADLANDPVLEGTTPEQRQLSLAKEYEADLRSGRMTQKDIIDLSYDARLSTEGTVSNHPAFSGKVYPIAIANKLNKAFGADKHRYVNAAAELSTISKTLMLTGDLAQYLQQGAPMMISHPKAWGRAVSASLKSLVDPNVSGRYFSNKENYEAATEFAQIGGSIGHLQDFMSGSGSGEFVNRIPGVRQLVTRSGRAFGTFFDISKIEMWKALRKNTPKEQAAEVVEMIDNIVLSGKMEAMGMAHGRAIAERLLLMAPSYYRGALQLVAGAGQKGVAGNEARKVLGTYATGMVAGMTGLYLAAGMSWEEIRNRLTPGADNDKFLSYPIKVGDRTMEIGPGGIVMQLISLMADMGDAMVNDPKKLIPWGPDNPMMKFLSSKLGPVPGFAKEWYTGKDSQGRLSSGPVEAASKLAMPIAAQTPVQKLIGIGKGNKSNLAMDATRSAVGFIGLKARTPSKANEMHVLANEFLKSKNLKKETGWEMTQTNEPSYSRLRSAALSGSESAFRQAYEGLMKTHTKAEIQAGMEKWYRRGFTGTVTHENRFYASLTPEQKKTYKEAKKEKLMIWKAYREMRRKM